MTEIITKHWRLRASLIEALEIMHSTQIDEELGLEENEISINATDSPNWISRAGIFQALHFAGETTGHMILNLL